MLNWENMGIFPRFGQTYQAALAQIIFGKTSPPSAANPLFGCSRIVGL
jgi:hypothetical protein